MIYLTPYHPVFSKQMQPIIAAEDDIQKQPFADVLKNFVIFTGKHLCWNNFVKKILQHRGFPANISN